MIDSKIRQMQKFNLSKDFIFVRLATAAYSEVLHLQGIQTKNI